MKTPAFKNVLLILLLLTGNTVQASIILGFNTLSQSANTLEIALTVSGLDGAAAPSLSTYDLDIGFDNTHLAFTGAAFGDPLWGHQLDVFNFGSNATVAEITSPGLLNLFELSLDAPEDLNTLQADSFTLATLSFNILNTGSSQLRIGINVFDDAYGNAIIPIVSPATITTIPLPSALWLMLGGLGMIFRRVR